MNNNNNNNNNKNNNNEKFVFKLKKASAAYKRLFEILKYKVCKMVTERK